MSTTLRRSRPSSTPLITPLLGLFVSLTAACTDEPLGGDGRLETRFNIRESVEQLHITHAEPGVTLTLLDAQGSELDQGTVDELGSLMFREVPPGRGLRIEQPSTGELSRSLQVLSVEESHPDTSLYERQALVPGFQYIETRDGTRLSAYITLPGPVEDGPYPTVVNYSGYDPSKPGGPIGLDLPAACDTFPTLCDAPNDPSAMIASLMGYATVSVNVRGTGCSGGAYDYFEPLQLLDGYDVIEVVGRQPWVLHNHVGMTGLSYPGISQMFVAKTRPPHLAAITPLAVIADTGTSVLLPGGIYNEGFALNWASYVLHGARPYGQGWEQGRVDEGDTLCEENQLLHGQAVDAVAKALANPFRDPPVADPLNPSMFADQIEVPLFMAGAWQDEQTGGHFPALFDKFVNSPATKYTVYNGAHMDGFTPHILSEWKTFLDLYVARQVPAVDPLIRGAAPLLFKELFGASLQLGPDRFAHYESHQEALAAYEAEDDVRVIFEVGGKAGGTPYAPEGSFEERFAAWPIPGTQPLRYFLNPNGQLTEQEPSTGADSGSSFRFNPALAERTNLNGNNPGVISPDWDWFTPEHGDAITFQTAELTEDIVLLGHGSADLWLRSTASDADIQVNVTEVLPSGEEMYIQSGMQRASHRKLAPEATALRPIKTHLQADAEDLPSGDWTLVRVEILPVAHVLRAGSRLRVNVQTPGGNHARWRFILKELGEGTVHSVAHSAIYPSSVVLSRVPGIIAPSEAPGCILRAQPCRAAAPIANLPYTP